MWDQSVPTSLPFLLVSMCFFSSLLVVGLLFSQISVGSEWSLFCILVVNFDLVVGGTKYSVYLCCHFGPLQKLVFLRKDFGGSRIIGDLVKSPSKFCMYILVQIFRQFHTWLQAFHRQLMGIGDIMEQVKLVSHCSQTLISVLFFSLPMEVFFLNTARRKSTSHTV